MKTAKRTKKPDYYIKKKSLLGKEAIFIFDNSQKRDKENKHMAIAVVPFDNERRTEAEAEAIASTIVDALNLTN